MIVNSLFHKVGKYAIVSAMIIAQNYRRQGIGNQLINYAEMQAKKIGCEFIELKSGMRRIKDGTHDFYKTLGYEDSAINHAHFKKNLT